MASSWSQNQLTTSNFSHRWAIEKFSYRAQQTITSSSFSDPNYPNDKWHLVLDAGSKTSDVRIALLIDNFVKGDKGWRYVKYKFSIINAAWIKCTVRNIDTEFICSGHNDVCHRYRRLVKRQDLFDRNNDFLPNDTLTILCEVWIPTDAREITGEKISKVQVRESHLSTDLSQLLISQEFSDCTLAVGDQSFKVHKGLLAARSPVFAAMFRNPMLEAQENRIDIEDVDPEVMGELLHFIYTGEAPQLNQLAMDLLGAADKYQLPRLKSMCENAMYGGVTPENACQMLVTCDLHSANQLKAHVMRCINTNADAVTKTEGWQQLIKHHPQLVTQVFKAKNSY